MRHHLTVGTVNMHLTNNAQLSIHTFKNHVVAGMSSMETSFPLYIWVCLLTQVIITINMI